jgi:hypothetical protein
MTHRSLPTLFGRYSMVLSGTQHLEVTLDKLGELALALGSSPSELTLTLPPSSLVAGLRTQLERRFGLEEGDGYFGTVLGEAPWLAPRIAELKRQHAAILAELERLWPIATDAGRWRELEAPLSGLIATFRAHERAESLLVSDFIRGNDGAGTG